MMSHPVAMRPGQIGRATLRQEMTSSAFDLRADHAVDGKATCAELHGYPLKSLTAPNPFHLSPVESISSDKSS
jgi:hypothetical protein